jgi:hypothetical protein
MQRKMSRRRVLQIAGLLGATAAVFAGSDIAERGNAGPGSAFARNVVDIPLRTSATFFPDAPVTHENRRPGTSQWLLTEGADTTFIQGYAGSVSALPGETVPLYVSSKIPATYTIEVYRMGWYGGSGGRLVFTQSDLHSRAQGTWTPGEGLIGFPTRVYDPATLLVDANWQPSFHLSIDPAWLSGVYLIKLIAANHAQSYIPLVVRAPDSRSAVLYSLPVNTYQAYNLWGGASLYGTADISSVGEGDVAHLDANASLHHAARALPVDEPPGVLKATKVSFNRPYARSAGSGDFLSWDIHLVQWMERNGLDVTYTTNVDLAEHPNSLLAHHIAVFGAHDEYWTQSMRDGAEQARDRGVSLAFLGANASYWQARLEPDHAGRPNRTLVCYKVATRARDPLEALERDPMYAQQPYLVTALWRDPAINRPENALIGLMYRSYFHYLLHDRYYLPEWVVSASAADPLLQGTGLSPGLPVAGGLLGYEYDAHYHNASTPANLVILARSPVKNVYHHQDRACTAYYRAASGALVFDAGTIWWGWGLSALVPRGAFQPNILQGNEAINRLTRNVFQAMLAAVGVSLVF